MLAKADRFVKAAVDYAEARGLPRLHTYWNYRGVIASETCLRGLLAYNQRAVGLAIAYDDMLMAQRGPQFCRHRAKNNTLELEMRVLRDQRLADTLLTLDNALSREIRAAKEAPWKWYADRYEDLTRIEYACSIPEYTVTKLQLISTFILITACASESERWRSCCESAKAAIGRLVALHFDDCQFFSRKDSNCEVLFTHEEGGSRSLRSILIEAYAHKDCSNCRLLAAPNASPK
jgi:hypothetical protein